MLWQVYTLITLGITTIVALFLHFSGLSGWELFTKTVLTLGCTTCVIWWVWCMKKIKDIASWWHNLHAQLDLAQQLLVETKQEITSIKQAHRQDNSLFS